MKFSLSILALCLLILACCSSRASSCTNVSSLAILPKSICCNASSGNCSLTFSYVSAFVLDAGSLSTYTLVIGNGQTLSLGGIYSNGQASTWGGSLVVQAGGTLWIGQVVFSLLGSQLLFEAGSTFHLTGNASISLPNTSTCLTVQSGSTLLLDLDSSWFNATNGTGSVLVIASNTTCLSTASSNQRFDQINGTVSIINVQTGGLELVWSGLGSSCDSSGGMFAIFTSGGCSPPAPPPSSPVPNIPPPIGWPGAPPSPPPLNTSNGTNATLSQLAPTDAPLMVNGYLFVIGLCAGILVILLIVAVLLFKFNPRVRQCVAPFRDRKRFVPTTRRYSNVSQARPPASTAV